MTVLMIGFGSNPMAEDEVKARLQFHFPDARLTLPLEPERFKWAVALTLPAAMEPGQAVADVATLLRLPPLTLLGWATRASESVIPARA